MGTMDTGAARRGDPFKLTTVGLLIVVVVMALVFGTRQMDRDAAERGRIDAAGSEVEAVALFLEEGDLPNAVLALHDIGLRLAPVEGAEDAAHEVVAAVEDELRAHDATRKELARAGRDIEALKGQLADARGQNDFLTEQNRALAAVRDLNAIVIRNVAEGRTALARRLLDAAENKDVVAVAAEGLVQRVEALCVAAGADGAERVHGLRTLARTWPVSGVADFAALAGAEEERKRRSRAALVAAEAALDRDEDGAAASSLTEAVKVAGVPEVESIHSRLVLLSLRRSAARAEKEGRLLDAAAAWRVAGEVKKAEPLEEKHRSSETAGFLAMGAAGFEVGGRNFEAAGCLELAHRITQDPRQIKQATGLVGQGWLLRQKEYRAAGLTEAALRCAIRAVEFVPEEASKLVEDLKGELEARKRNAALDALVAALDAGAPALAAQKVEDADPSAEIRDRLDAALRASKVERARAALHAGDGQKALELLRGSEADAALVAEAEILAGDVSKGADALTGSNEEKALVLLSAGWIVVERDAARAARLGLKALAVTGGRPGAVALLTAALDAAGDPPKGDELWDAVRAAIFEAAAGGPGVR